MILALEWDRSVVGLSAVRLFPVAPNSDARSAGITAGQCTQRPPRLRGVGRGRIGTVDSSCGGCSRQ